MSKLRVDEIESVDGISSVTLAHLAETTTKTELATAGGSGLVGRFDSVSGLLDITPVDRATYEVIGYHSGSFAGGGEFTYDASMAQTAHNGGTVIAKDAVFPVSWDNLTQRQAWFDGPSSGTGCYIKKYSKEIDLREFGAIDGEPDSSITINEFLAYCKANNKNINAEGTYNITAPFTFAIKSGSINTFDLNLTTLNSSVYGVVFSPRKSVNYGKIDLICGPENSNLSLRRQEVGFLLRECNNAIMGKFTVSGTLRDGVVIDSEALGEHNNNMFRVESIFSRWVGGSYNSTAGPQFRSQIVSITNTGAFNSTAQRSEVVVADALLDNLRADDFVNINDECYIIMSLDATTKTVTLFPQLKSDVVVSDNIDFIVGAAARIIGRDSNVGHIGLVDATYAGTVLYQQSLFGATVETVHSSVHGVSVAVGTIATGAGGIVNGGGVGYLYSETGFNPKLGIIEVGLNINNYYVHTGGDFSGEVSTQHKLLKPLGLTRNKNIRTQHLSEASNAVFRSINVKSSDNDDLGIRHTKYTVLGNATPRVILLGKETDRCSGVIRGTGLNGTYQRNQCTIAYTISGRPASGGGGTSFSVEITGRFDSTTLYPCTVTYEGETWYGIYATTWAPLNEVYFQGNIEPVAVTAASGLYTDLVQVSGDTEHRINERFTFSAAGDIELTTVGKGVILASPNGTRYKLTVSDAGALVITTA